MSSNIILDEMESDLLTEILNIGVGKAAGSLSRIVNQEIKLSIPSVKFRSIEGIAKYLGWDSPVCSISQVMRGPFEARSMLLFPANNSMDIVQQMLGGHLSNELVAEMQEEALNEIGNIVLNACIGAIATSLGEKFDVELPVFEQNIPIKLLSPYLSDEQGGGLLIRINLELSKREISGHMVFLLRLSSQANLDQCLKRMLLNFNFKCA